MGLEAKGLPALDTGKRLFACPLLAVAFGLLALASTAQASFHLMKVREVYPAGTSGYVELQMYSSGQNFVGGHHVTTYDTGGTVVDNYPIPGNVTGPNAGDNQKTILFAGPSYAGPTADFTNPALNLPAAGGAVCFDAIPVDCVSWGTFAGNGSLPTSAGSPASPSGVTAGKALRRSIAPGCPTLLESADDTNNSAADFSEQNPSPRNNASAPLETPCGSSPNTGGGGNKQGDQGKGQAPQTTLKRRPPQRSRDRTPTFRFVADEAGVTFRCRVDHKPFKVCRSPFTTRRLSLGKHTFQVRAVDSSGATDQSPATDSFRVIRRA